MNTNALESNDIFIIFNNFTGGGLQYISIQFVLI